MSPTLISQASQSKLKRSLIALVSDFLGDLDYDFLSAGTFYVKSVAHYPAVLIVAVTEKNKIVEKSSGGVAPFVSSPPHLSSIDRLECQPAHVQLLPS